jgi:hypothetical protein
VIQGEAELRRGGGEPEEQSVDDMTAAACPIPHKRKGLTKLEWGELTVIALALPALFFGLGDLSWTPKFGALVAYAAALFLGQGLVRDLVRLGIEGRKDPTKKLLCMCAETSIGVVALAAGLGLLMIGIKDTVALTPMRVTAIAAGILVAGFIAKDYVLIIRRETDHGSVIVG